VSDLFYNFIWLVGSHPFLLSSRTVVLHRERLKRPGGYILASTHLSEFDVAVLIVKSPRKLDWVSIVEVFRKPFVGWFYGSMNAFPLDRSRPDSPTVRVILDRLARGRVVAMFPEGNIRTPETSVLNGGHFKPGVARIAQLADVPVVPCVVLGAGAYTRVKSWLPIKRVRWGINIGEPLTVRKDLDKHEATTEFGDRLRSAYLELHEELKAAMAARA
jgi:1-acyl-sn-glycerol-3-phosphate acyltransferase